MKQEEKIKRPDRIEGAPTLIVDGVRFHFYRSATSEEIRSEDDTIIITQEAGNRRVAHTYRARYKHHSVPGFLMDIYSKRHGNVRKFNFPTSAARVALRMLEKSKGERHD